MVRDKGLSLLSLAAKAGKAASGGFLTEQSVKSGRAFLVVVAQDASENTRRQIADMCAYYKVPMTLKSNKADLGRSIGKGERSSVAVTDPGFADGLKKIWMD